MKAFGGLIMAATMRAKLRLGSVMRTEYGEKLEFSAVGPKGSYPADGSDEDNTYARFSPSATFVIHVANPALIGKFNPGETYYVDFTPAAVNETEAAA
jgi:hypothetical protein